VRKRRAECVAFGEAVRALRESKGYSQEEFANHADVHRTYMGGIERGERNPTLTTICKIAAALAVPPARLLDGLGGKR
jgi:transcriptional regulator with XRE-family HTH domain